MKRILVLLLGTALIICCLTGCNKANTDGGFFEDGNGTASMQNSNNKTSSNSGPDTSAGGKVQTGKSDSSGIIADNKVENSTTIENNTNNTTTKPVEEEEEWHEPEVIEKPVPTWANDNTYSLADLKPVDAEDENNKTFYVADKIYITITDDKVLASDLDINYTYTFGSLQPVDPDDEKETDYVLFLTKEYTFEEITALKDQLDSISEGFTATIKTVDNISSWAVEGIPESEEQSNINTPPTNTVSA